MRTFAVAAVTTAILMGTAQAQQNSTDPLQLQYEQQRKEQMRVEQEYNATMKRTQRGTADPNAKKDPWATVRTTDEPAKTKR